MKPSQFILFLNSVIFIQIFAYTAVIWKHKLICYTTLACVCIHFNAFHGYAILKCKKLHAHYFVHDLFLTFHTCILALPTISIIIIHNEIQHARLTSYPGLLTPVQATNAAVRRPGYKANARLSFH